MRWLVLLVSFGLACGDGGDGDFPVGLDVGQNSGQAGADASGARPDAPRAGDAGVLDASEVMDADAGVDTEVGPRHDASLAPFGQAAAMPCDDARLCEEGLDCLRVDPSHTVGFCAPRCAELHSTCGFFGAGVRAECSLERPGGGLSCGFVCVLDHGDHVHNYSCPSGDWGRLRCERRSRWFGHRYCAPSQEP